MGGIAKEPLRWGAIRCTIAAAVISIAGQNGVFSSVSREGVGVYRLNSNTTSWPAARTPVFAIAEGTTAMIVTVVRVDDDTIEIRTFDAAGAAVEATAFDVWLLQVN